MGKNQELTSFYYAPGIGLNNFMIIPFHSLNNLNININITDLQVRIDDREVELASKTHKQRLWPWGQPWAEPAEPTEPGSAGDAGLWALSSP